MKSKKNLVPVGPFNLRVRGPQRLGDLPKGIRYAHGKGADRRATIDPEPCPGCGGKVEWTLTYKRDGEVVTPYLYGRCRTSPKSHRWDFTHWVPEKRSARVYAKPTPPTPVVPPPRASPAKKLAGWIDSRISVLTEEIEKLKKMGELANDVQHMERGLFSTPRPSYPGVLPNPTPPV